ncbi:MAG: 8-oxo-dGTP diphosphatase [Clostridia bacterium]|nr:8-oxo-dGTP diphosphatase [Clostridia bacterium]
MVNSSLCYIEKDCSYLMLYRNKKKSDPNAGKWIGVGGKFLEGESPTDCVIREVREETGLELKSPRFRGLVTFTSDIYETEQMFLFTADSFKGTLSGDCDEGELRWVPKDRIAGLNLWEGDRQFLKLLADDAPFFLMKLEYEGDKLVRSTLFES